MAYMAYNLLLFSAGPDAYFSFLSLSIIPCEHYKNKLDCFFHPKQGNKTTPTRVTE